MKIILFDNYAMEEFEMRVIITGGTGMIIILVTNFISPPLYLIWHWIAFGFPTEFLFIWLGALASASTGIILLAKGDG